MLQSFSYRLEAAFVNSIPGIAYGWPRLTPLEPRRSALQIPSGVELFLYVIPFPAGVMLARFPAIPIRGLIHAVRPVRRGIRPLGVVVTPIGVLDGRFHFLAHVVTREAAWDGTNRAAHGKANRTANDRTNRGARRRCGRSTDTGADRVRARRVSEWIKVQRVALFVEL